MKKIIVTSLLAFLFVFAEAQLYIGGGATVQINGTITLHNTDFVKSGPGSVVNFAPESNVLFTGDRDNIVSGYISFLNCEIAKEGMHKVSLDHYNEELRGNMLFTSGYFDLNGNTLLLTGSGTLVNENENSRIVGATGGSVYTTVELNQPNNLNPGNIGCTITSAKALGQVRVNRGYVVSYGFPTHAVQRYYSFSFTDASKNSGLDATLKFHYFDAEKEALDEAKLAPWKSDAFTQTWEEQGPTENISRNTTENWVQLSGIDMLPVWTLAEQLSPVPVTFSEINIRCNENNAIISWATATESNTDHFEVQRSKNGIDWISVASLLAEGKMNSRQLYSFEDDGAANDASAFYRIASVDRDEHIYYSIAKPSSCKAAIVATVWPNPVTKLVNMRIVARQHGEVRIRLIDAKGAVIRQWQRTLSAGSNALTVNLDGVVSGSYHLVASDKNGQVQLSEKLVKQ